jgi:hypothetical protein
MFITHGNGLLISLVFWGAIVLIVFISNFFGYRERTSRHRAIETLAEKGQPIPPELLGRNGGRDFYDSGYRGWHRYSLSGGIYLMCVGVALFVFLWALTTGSFNAFFGGGPDSDFVAPGFLPYVAIFPFMIGLSRVLAYFFDRPRNPPT